MSEKKENPDSLVNIYREVGPYLTLGFQLAVTIVIMLFIGNWLDEKFDKNPLFMIIFGFLGIAAGMYNLIKSALRISEKQKKK